MWLPVFFVVVKSANFTNKNYFILQKRKQQKNKNKKIR